MENEAQKWKIQQKILKAPKKTFIIFDSLLIQNDGSPKKIGKSPTMSDLRPQLEPLGLPIFIGLA